MTCPKCNSDNVKVQAQKEKNPIATGITMLFAGLGLMFLGLLGLLLGLIIGLVVGLIIKALTPQTLKSVAVCQNCGNIFNPDDVPINDKKE